MLSALLERLAIIAAVISRRLMTAHGRIETRRRRRDPSFTRGDMIPLASADTPYTRARVARLEELIERHQLQALVIFGCSFGTEIKALAARRPGLHLVGADLSARVIAECRRYNLPNVTFEQIDMERTGAVRALLQAVAPHGRTGVYFCETGPYLLPERLQEFFATLATVREVSAVQILEPLFLDWQSRFQIGALFAWQDGHWRHNYAGMLQRAGFTITETDFVPPSLRSDVHRHQPLWLVRAARP